MAETTCLWNRVLEAKRGLLVDLASGLDVVIAEGATTAHVPFVLARAEFALHASVLFLFFGRRCCLNSKLVVTAEATLALKIVLKSRALLVAEIRFYLVLAIANLGGA